MTQQGLFGLSWLGRVSKKPSVKADLVIRSNIITVSGQCVSVAATLKWILIFVRRQMVFPNPVTYTFSG